MATLVDDKDFLSLSRWRWFYCADGYVRARICGKKVTMHRLINNTPDNLSTDHIDGNKLNNQRYNLRNATTSENGFNRKIKQQNNSSGYKGVTWHKQTKKWQAQIMVQGKQIYLGTFNEKRVAAYIYNEAAKKYHGTFARLNQL